MILNLPREVVEPIFPIIAKTWFILHNKLSIDCDVEILEMLDVFKSTEWYQEYYFRDVWNYWFLQYLENSNLLRAGKMGMNLTIKPNYNICVCKNLYNLITYHIGLEELYLQINIMINDSPFHWHQYEPILHRIVQQ